MRDDTIKLVAALRGLADFWESRPDLPIPYLSPLNVMVDVDKLPEVARMIGSASKNYGDDWFTLRKNIAGVDVDFFCSRDKMCRRVVKGKRLIPASVIETKEREEEIVEWECPESLLDLEEEESNVSKVQNP